MSDEPPAKRAKSTARRALSCTECKRRKTKCGVIGKIPCDSCIKRGKPNDCVWEGVTDIPHPDPGTSHPPSASVALLQDQIRQLTARVDRLERRPLSASTDRPTSSFPVSPSLSNRIPPPVRPPNEPNASEESLGDTRAVERETNSLENDIFGPGLRPGITVVPSFRPAMLEVASSSVRSTQQQMGASRQADPMVAGVRRPTASGAGDKGKDKEATVEDLKTLLKPSQSGLAHELVKWYFEGPMHMGFHVVHQYHFRDTYRIVTTLSPEEQNETDRAWWALYYQILAVSVRFGPTSFINHLFAPTPWDPKPLPDLLHQLSLSELENSDYQAVPQVRHIQVALLYIYYLFHFGNSPAKANLALRHLDSAITTAQWLSLDILSLEEVPVLLKNDPAMRGLPVEAAMNLAKQLFASLNSLDGTIYKRARVWRLQATSPHSTPPPANLTDYQSAPQYANSTLGNVDVTLIASSTSSSFGSAIPEDTSVFTESSLCIMGSAFANTIRQHTKDLSTDEMTFDETLAFSQDLERILELMPSWDNLQTDSAWMMYVVYSSIHNRILRMHRPYMHRGYADARLWAARETSIKAASRIIQAQSRVATKLRPAFVKRWILGASIVLALDALLVLHPLCAHAHSPTERENVRSNSLYYISTAKIDIFDKDDQSQDLNRLCSRAVGILVVEVANAGEAGVFDGVVSVEEGGAGRVMGIEEFSRRFLARVKRRLLEGEIARKSADLQLQPDIDPEPQVLQSLLGPNPSQQQNPLDVFDFFGLSFLNQPTDGGETHSEALAVDGAQGQGSGDSVVLEGLGGGTARGNSTGTGTGLGLTSGLDESALAPSQGPKYSLGFWEEFGWNLI
ncbi:hypothetical protein IAR50_005813 [Cryptococcus sp. DSM 104548]